MTILTRLLVAAVSGTVAVLAYQLLRDREAPTIERRPDAEPVLGYDGMDLDTVLPWLESAELDRDTLLDIRDYERAHRGRESVLQLVDELLD